MPEYRIQAVANNGRSIQEKLTAESEQDAVAMLDARGLFPVRIELAQKPAQRFFGRRRVSPRQMATFYSQLADLLHVGVPLLRCLEVLERQTTSPRLVQILREVRAKVADGTTLAD